eukprot:COSAG02_NODE_1208_length_13883_cov_54.757998_11_plen_75_part_00
MLLLSDWLGVSVAASGQEDNICPFILSFVLKLVHKIQAEAVTPAETGRSQIYPIRLLILILIPIRLIPFFEIRK